MGKERKPQTGATNLSARPSNNGPTPSIASTTEQQQPSVGEHKIQRDLAHKLLAPDLYQTEKKAEHYAKLKVTATWTPLSIYNRDFETTNKDDYRNPASYPPREEHTKTTLDIATEGIKEQGEVEAINNMCKLVRTSYGTVATMLRSFHKKPADNLSIFEFGEYLKRNKLESYLPPDERKKIFDHIDPHHNGNVLVKDFLKKVEEYEFLGQGHNHELQKVRDYLALSIHQKREEMASTRELEAMTKEEATLTKEQEIERLKQTKGVSNETEKIRRALGMRTFDLDVDHEELDMLLEENFHKLPANEAHRKYARFLHHSHLKLNQIPFYDMRATELDRLKHRAVGIDHILESDEVGGRFKELAKTRWNGSKTTLNYTDSMPTFHQNNQNDNSNDADSLDNSFDNSFENDAVPVAEQRGQMAVSKSLPNLKLSARPSPLAAAPSSPALLHHPHQSASSPNPYNSNGQPVRLEALRKPETNRKQNQRSSSPTAGKTRNLIGEQNRGVEYDEMSSVQSITLSDDATSLLSNIPPSLKGTKSVATLVASLSSEANKKPVSKLRSGLLDQHEKKLQASDFFTQIYDESTSMGRLKNPASVMRIEKIDPHVYQPSCRKSIQQGPTDWSRVGFGGSTSEGGGGYGDSNESDRFMTTNAKLYPPLIYEPSQPIQRNLVSDADISAQKKAYIRQQRYARKCANMEVTQTRLEYEALEKQIRSLRREQSRIEDNIRYKTSIFLDDLQQFRSQPLQRMAKRQNIELFDRMWNGSTDKQTVQLVSENRDFKTTYSTSFQSDVLKQSFNNLMGDGFQTKQTHHHEKGHDHGGGSSSNRPTTAPTN